jgi:hypothetical protein
MRRVRLVVVLLTLVALALPASPSEAATSFRIPKLTSTRSADRAREMVRRHIHGWKLSQGARAWLNADRLRAKFSGELVRNRYASTPSFGSNVDANDPSQDLAGGQSETSIGANSNDGVLTMWNDVSGFLWPDSTDLRGSATGVGYSDDGGATFTDLIGLPNPSRNQLVSGDPSVVTIDDTHFAVASLYYPSFTSRCRRGPIYLTAAVWIGTVSGGTVSFSDPILAAHAGNLCNRHHRRRLSAIDKEYLAYDATSRTLALSYTRFSFFGSGLGAIEVRRASVPADPATLSVADFTSPVAVWNEEDYCRNSSELTQCGAINQGAYPAVAPNGDVYVTWERNILSNIFFSLDPFVYIHAAVVPSGATAPSAGGMDAPVVLTEGQVHAHANGGVKSLDSVIVSGYSRGFGNDFPRVAFDPVGNQVVFVWNDANLDPLGDIWLRSTSTDLFTMDPIQQVNDDSSFALHMLPAVSVGSDGSIRTSWYDRRTAGADSTDTELWAEVRPDATTGASDFEVTTGPTDWAGTSSLVNPNFGDYTDNATVGTTTYYTWSDGRIGVPQPFVDSATVP